MSLWRTMEYSSPSTFTVVPEYFDDLEHLGLLLRGCCQDQAALGLFLGLELLEDHTVCQRFEFHNLYAS